MSRREFEDKKYDKYEVKPKFEHPRLGTMELRKGGCMIPLIVVLVLLIVFVS